MQIPIQTATLALFVALFTGTVRDALQEFLYTRLGSALLPLALPRSSQLLCHELLWLLPLSQFPEAPLVK